MFSVGLAVDQNQVGAEVAVTMVCPLADKGMVTMAPGELEIRCQVRYNMCKIRINGAGKASLLFASVIPPEGPGPSNRPH